MNRYPRFAGLAILEQKAERLYSNGKWRGTDPLMCQEQGGMVHVSYETDPAAFTNPFPLGGPDIAVFHCVMPYRPPSGGAASGPINITVPTTVQTTVNPQISPPISQQSSPSNSPIGTSTDYESDSSQSSNVPSSPGMVYTPADETAETALPATIAGSMNNIPWWLIGAVLIGAVMLSKDEQKGRG